MFTRLLKYSVKNILRNKFLSLSSILILTLLMFFINLLLVMYHTSFELINYVNNKISISLYLDDKYNKNSKDVIDLMGKLKNISPKSNIKYKSQDEVLEEIKKHDIELVRILEKQNPLPNTITISKIPLSDYEKLNYVIEWKLYLFWWNDNLNSKDLFSSYSAQYNRINSRIVILNSIILWLYVIIGMFVFAIWIISYSIIWNFIYYYRDEIYITKLVWWSKAFIYGPFSLQGVIYSMIAFLISLWLFYGFIKLGITFDILSITYVFNDIFEKSKYVFLFELLLFIVIWALSWYFSSKKYLN